MACFLLVVIAKLAIPAREGNRDTLFRRDLLEIQIDVNTLALIQGPRDPEPDKSEDKYHANGNQARGRRQTQTWFDEVEPDQDHPYNKAPHTA